MENNKSLNWVDALKGLAICGVVCVHSGGKNLPSIYGIIGANGSKCVQLFFLISAYLTYISLDHYYKNRTETITFSSMKKWWARKFLRLIPMYYVALAVYAPLSPRFNGWLGSEGHVTIKNFISHLLFLNGLIPHYANSIIGVEWYLGVLGIFYMIAPFIYKYVDSFEKSAILFVLATVGSSYINDFGYARVPMVTDEVDSQIYSSFFGTHWIITQLPTLVIGIMIYFLLKSNAFANIKHKKILSVVLFLYSCFMALAEMRGYTVIYRTSIYTVFGACFAGILISQTLWSYKIFDNPVIRTLGKYSYPIFLVHYALIMCYDKVITTITGIYAIDWFIKYIIILAVSLGLGYIGTRFYDKPVYNKVCKMLNI
jgi:peptidoglycan/LPS O-acetylase OafA/YrhL